MHCSELEFLRMVSLIPPCHSFSRHSNLYEDPSLLGVDIDLSELFVFLKNYFSMNAARSSFCVHLLTEMRFVWPPEEVP